MKSFFSASQLTVPTLWICTTASSYFFHSLFSATTFILVIFSFNALQPFAQYLLCTFFACHTVCMCVYTVLYVHTHL